MTESKTAIPKDLVIGLHRTMYPVAFSDYSFFVYGDVRILCEGRHYVAVKGKQEGQISRAQVKQLLGEVYRMNYFSPKKV